MARRRAASAHDILTADEVAEAWRVSRETVLRLARRDEIPAFKVGGQYRFRRADLEKCFFQQPILGGEPYDTTQAR